MTRDAALTTALALPLLALAACDEADPDTGDDGASTERVTYYEDVLPVFAKHCNTCHTAGAVAPFAFDDYQTAADLAPRIAIAVQQRTMPPYSANNDGSCNTFVDAQWLSDDEIDLISTWAEDGAEEGDPTTPRPEVRPPNALRGNDIVEMSTPENYIPVPEDYPGGELEDYQCFLAMPSKETEQFLIGFDVIPGNKETVHHVLVFEVDPGFLGNGQKMAALDAESPDQPGWDCTGAIGEDVVPQGVPVAWAPGTGAVNFPEGTGIRIEAGHALVMQMHYNLLTDMGADNTVVELSFADEVEREARQTLTDPFLVGAFLGEPEQLEPGLEHAIYEWSMPLSETGKGGGEGPVEIWGFLPHMHKRGNAMSIEIGPEDSMSCGAQIDRWDFNWQREYFLQTPIKTHYDEHIRVTCDFDTSRDTDPVLPGFGSDDEMCLVGLYLVQG